MKCIVRIPAGMRYTFSYMSCDTFWRKGRINKLILTCQVGQIGQNEWKLFLCQQFMKREFYPRISRISRIAGQYDGGS
jgi:hypothetical protein